ncbi:hypothetical protein AB0B50_01630 [Streptomyces sp. NPDC041068]|uniref:hypothetical protein n=1 Tax=Streptomyces sp. NPDC041068 TaxID=3155130 RepID=UPI0033C77D4B
MTLKERLLMADSPVRCASLGTFTAMSVAGAEGSAQPSRPDARTWYSAVESAFTSVFESDLWGDGIRRAVADWLGPAAVHYVEGMPGRKYRAVLPWLTVRADAEYTAHCLMPELLFSVFYCLDDLDDGKRLRYGAPTGLAVHGPTELATTVERAAHGLPGTGPLSRLPDGLWSECVADMTAGQRSRGSLAPEDFAWERYVETAVRRIAFVGHSWEYALACASERQAVSFVRRVYPWCAAAGQLRNDLRNTTGREGSGGGIPYSDVYAGRVSAVSGLLLERAEGADRRWLLSRVWGRHPAPEDTHARLDAMIADLGIRADVVAAVKQCVERIREPLGTVGLHSDVRTLWDAWITRQIEVGVYRDCEYADDAVDVFTQAVAALRAVR